MVVVCISMLILVAMDFAACRHVFKPQGLIQAGFKKTLTNKQWSTKMSQLQQSEISRTGPYRLEYILQRGEVTVTIEQNTSKQLHGGLEATVTYPSVAVVEGPKGRVACDPENTELILQMADELS